MSWHVSQRRSRTGACCPARRGRLGRRARNLHAVDGCPPQPAGTGARCRAHEVASALTGRRSAAGLPRGRPLGPCLSFCLIHPRPGPFTDVHPDRVCAVRGRWRMPVNAGQHCWKACWVQALASSNLASSATLTCKNTRRDRWQDEASRSRGLIWWAHFPAALRAAADIIHRCCAWSRASRMGLNGGAHAAEACAVPFRAGRDRPRPAGYPTPTYRPHHTE